MGTEIEKKFLIADNRWRDLGSGIAICQGYLLAEKGLTVRVRTFGEKGYLTVKGPAQGEIRPEYEYEIPLTEAQEMLQTLCLRPVIEKMRYCISFAGFVWEVDEFFGENEGLLLAEIELETAGQFFEKPPWVGLEVTGDHRYYNAWLAKHPYREWKGTI